MDVREFRTNSRPTKIQEIHGRSKGRRKRDIRFTFYSILLFTFIFSSTKSREIKRRTRETTRVRTSLTRLIRRSIRWTSSGCLRCTARSSAALENRFFVLDSRSKAGLRPTVSRRCAELHSGIFFPRSPSRARLKAIDLKAPTIFASSISASSADCYFFRYVGYLLFV